MSDIETYLRDADEGDVGADVGADMSEWTALYQKIMNVKTLKNINTIVDTGNNNNTNTNNNNCDFCPKGGAVILHPKDGLYVCMQCNVVADRVIDGGAEWRCFANDSSFRADPTRCGMPINNLLPESSMGTMIGMVPNESYHMRMLRKYQSWTSMPYKERSLYGVFDTLSINAGNGGIPTSIVTEAKNLYKQASASGVTRGSNRSGLIASSMYVACKRANVPRSAKEMAKMFHIQQSTMTRGCKRFQEIVPIELGLTRPSDFVQRMMSRLSIDKSVRDACMRAVEIVQDMGLVEENSPPSVAATCIFMVCVDLGLNKIDKKQVAAACDVSIVTISRCYKKLLPYKDLFIGT